MAPLRLAVASMQLPTYYIYHLQFLYTPLPIHVKDLLAAPTSFRSFNTRPPA